MPVAYQVLKYCNSELKPADGPDIWLYAIYGARDILHEHGGVITGQYATHRILTGLRDEYEYVRKYGYNQRDFGLKDIRRTMHNIYADNLSRISLRGKSVVGGGFPCMRKITPMG